MPVSDPVEPLRPSPNVLAAFAAAFTAMVNASPNTGAAFTAVVKAIPESGAAFTATVEAIPESGAAFTAAVKAIPESGAAFTAAVKAIPESGAAFTAAVNASPESGAASTATASGLPFANLADCFEVEQVLRASSGALGTLEDIEARGQTGHQAATTTCTAGERRSIGGDSPRAASSSRCRRSAARH